MSGKNKTRANAVPREELSGLSDEALSCSDFDAPNPDVSPQDEAVSFLWGDGGDAGSSGHEGIPSSTEASSSAGGLPDVPLPADSTITWRTERRRLGDLVEWDRNPRRLTVKQAQDLHRSIARFGYVDAIVVNADGRSIIGGHQRRKVILSNAMMDPDAMIDVRIPSRELTPREFEELAIRLNRNQGEWDYEILANSFDEVDLLDWGFEAKEFSIEDPRLGAVQPTEDTKPITVADSEIRVHPGDVWEIGTNGSRIMCGDPQNAADVDRVLGHDKIDFCFTSPNPPTNEAAWENHKAVIREVHDHMEDGRFVAWNVGSSQRAAMPAQYACLSDVGFTYQRNIVWKKSEGKPQFQNTRAMPVAGRLTPNFQHENVGLFTKGDTIVYGGPVVFDDTLVSDVFELPAEKETTTRLAGAFVQHLADVGKIVFDPFMGTGSTVLAAENLERVGVGMEPDARKCEIALRRAEAMGMTVKKR